MNPVPLKERVKVGYLDVKSHDADLHPLAVCNGVNLMDTDELVALDVSRLQCNADSGREEADIRQILVTWVRKNGLEYKQGMHEVCYALYLRTGCDVERCQSQLQQIMDWLWPLFYRDNGVNVWIDDELIPLISAASPTRLGEILQRKFHVVHAIWCIRWCRLLFIRELSGADGYGALWDVLCDDDQTVPVSQKGHFVACCCVVLLLNVIPELCASQDENEVLSVLLNFPGPRIPVERVVHYGLALYHVTDRNDIDKFKHLEDQILQESNGEWFAKYGQYDVGRVRMEMRLRRRTLWRLGNTRTNLV